MNLPGHVAKLSKRAFSPRVEDSIRLRVIGMAFLWLAALGIVWSGGDIWFTLGSAVLGTVGSTVSWYRRNRKSRLFPLLIATSIIAASFLLRSQVLEALTGNWLPLGQFLILVQALASFDLRTRGGLYTTLILSGMVLFFVSQQAFNDAFGIFIIGFVVLLLAFLSVSFLEDGVRSARVYWKKHQASTVIFWVGAACGVFIFSGLAFWVMPRGETNLGLPQIAILPFSANSLDGTSAGPDVNPAAIPKIVPVSLNRQGEATAGPPVSTGVNAGGANAGASFGLVENGNSSGLRGGLYPDAFDPGQIPGDAFLGMVNRVGQRNDVMFFVRSKVASYWKGRTMDTFDGRYWHTSDALTDLARSRNNPGLLINLESRGLDNRLRYGQIFFIQQDVPDAVFTGYRGVRILAEEGSLQGVGVRAGDSYRVLSAHPRHSLEGLREGRAGWLGAKYLELPPGSARLSELARLITQGTTNDFANVERIMGHLALQGNYDRRRPGDLTSSASLDEFLFEGKPGSVLDYATATVMLTRAAGLPARLAIGYLPGIRDPLSGAFMVRESDAHAWAEVFFEGQGWVPIDSAPRPDITLLFNTNSGIGYLFQGGFGEKAFQAAKSTPSALAEAMPNLGDMMDSQALLIGSAALFFIMSVVLSWRRFQGMGRRRRNHRRPVGLVYSLLPGDERRKVLKLYRKTEKLLRKVLDADEREPWQTVGDYSRWADAGGTELLDQVSWFTHAVWQAAYNPDDLPAGLAAEGKERLSRLKAELKGVGLA